MGDLGGRIVALLLAISTVVSVQADVIQEHQFLSVKEGDSIQLNCSYQETEYSLQWYKQYPGSQPEFLILLMVSRTEARNRFEMTLDTKKKTTSLRLKESQLKDSAVYFCALEPSYGYGNKVIFGRGTSLIIIPNLEDSEPSVYQLKSSKEPNNIAACLVTDYSPNPIDVNISRTVGEPTNGSLVVVKDGNKESASLGVVLWGKNDDDFHCSATYKNISYEAEKSGADMCSETTPSGLLEEPVFETDERLNLLSLTVLGLRLIFFKSVALNLILTYHAWSR